VSMRPAFRSSRKRATTSTIAFPNMSSCQSSSPSTASRAARSRGSSWAMRSITCRLSR